MTCVSCRELTQELHILWLLEIRYGSPSVSPTRMEWRASRGFLRVHVRSGCERGHINVARMTRLSSSWRLFHGVCRPLLFKYSPCGWVAAIVRSWLSQSGNTFEHTNDISPSIARVLKGGNHFLRRHLGKLRAGRHSQVPSPHTPAFDHPGSSWWQYTCLESKVKLSWKWCIAFCQNLPEQGRRDGSVSKSTLAEDLTQTRAPNHL